MPENCNENEREKRKKRLKTFGLVLCNVLLFGIAIISTVLYSTFFKREQERVKVDAFVSAVESMKSVSANYLDTEKNFAADWAAYIDSHNMTIDGALDYIRATNTNEDRYAHIVDMDTFEARSTYSRSGDDSVSCYRYIHTDDIDVNRIFIKNMQRMLSDDSRKISVLGKYKVSEMQMYVISVGTKVSLKVDGGEKKDFLLLRVIPVEQVRKIWIFQMEYSEAEVGIITSNGSYVIQSPSMKSESFLDMIRAYNFADDYNKVDDLKNRLENTESGLMEYKDFRGNDGLWYYSSFDSDSGLDIIGYIRKDELITDHYNWGVVIITCGLLLLIAAIDGAHILRINRSLRETAAIAERANQAKTQFLSSMSHDIRTPMNAVIGMTDIAKKNINDPEYVMSCLDKVSAAGSQLLTLINDILDISKVESGRMVLNPSRVSVDGLFSSIVTILRPQMEQKHLIFSGDYSDLPHDCLFADELRLNQIFLNILTNSVKYTPDGGSIEMHVSEEPVDSDDGSVCLVFTAADTGIGMTEEFQKSMYDSFERATNTRINKIQGSGLGLAIVKQMVDLMNGTIECESAPDKGTKFTVRIVLPVAGAENYIADGDDVSAPGGDDADFSGMHVLVAEDNDLNWEIAQTLLSEFGISCDRVENGKKCVEKLEEIGDGTYDMVLMDIQMPEMNGRQATRIIRESDRAYLRNLPIIAMTADAFAEDVQACLDSGMNGHISKPIDINKILEFLRKIQQEKRKDIE